MKKFYYLLLALIVTFSSNAWSKTEGFYVGLDVLNAKSKVNVKTVSVSNINPLLLYYGVNDEDFRINGNLSDSKTSLGFDAKYAVNFDKFYVAPGISLDYLNLNNKKYIDDMDFDINLKISSRFSYKVDLGYDIDDRFSIFVPLGINNIAYKLNTIDSIIPSKNLLASTSGAVSSFFYGIGVNTKINEKLALKLEYNKTSLDIDSKTSTVQFFANTKIRNSVDLDIFKVGAVYKF